MLESVKKNSLHCKLLYKHKPKEVNTIKYNKQTNKHHLADLATIESICMHFLFVQCVFNEFAFTR